MCQLQPEIKISEEILINNILKLMMSSNYILLWLLLGACQAKSPIIQTNYGLIEGTTNKLFDGKKVDAFLGVPYAVPPIGRYRFTEPSPPAPWNEPIKTNSFCNGCIQPVSKEAKEAIWFLSEAPESEDCLCLNIWTPNKRGQNKMAVMVFIHAGAFNGGSASQPLYDGSILAAENNVVVVSMNYRLAMFGFMYLNSSGVPGNAGLQDQILALKWVNENIEHFGGDPKRVTIFGESAGGTSVGLHLLNPALSGLFQYAIMQGGSAYQDIFTKTQDDALKTSLDVANKAGCLDDDSQKMLDCLRAKPAADLVKQNFGLPEYLRVSFVPVKNGIEVPVVLSKAVQAIPDTRRENIISLNIPQEASVVTPLLFPGKNFAEDLSVSEDEFRVLLENYFHLSDRRLQDAVLHEYRNFEIPYNSSQLREEALGTVTDNLFTCPGIDFTKSWLTETNQVYYLYFTHPPSKPLKVPLPSWAVPTHGDEVPFVFGAPLDPKNGYTKAEVKLSKIIMSYWTNFAKTGDPNQRGKTSWPSVESIDNFTYLKFENKARKLRNLKERECAFWDNVYPELLSMQEELGRTR